MATASIQTYLAPGQRYSQPGGAFGYLERQVTVTGLGFDHLGLARVTFNRLDGEAITLYVSQVEAAIADGELVPIVGAGRVALS